MFLYLENMHGRIEGVNTDLVIRVEQARVPVRQGSEDFEDDPNSILLYLMPDGKYRHYQGTVRDFVITVEKLSDPQNVPPIPPG